MKSFSEVRMDQALFARRTVLFAFTASMLFTPTLGAQRPTTGSLSGTVVGEDGKAISSATLQLQRNDGANAQASTSDEAGSFTIRGLAPGLYRITARRIGFREAQLPSLRIVAGQTTQIRVSLTASPTQLSTVEVRVSPTSIDASTSELARTLRVDDVKLVPSGRDATSLIELVPGASRGFVWGGASDAANNYQLDGVSVNHPGNGGEFLSTSVDWIEALEVRGLGAGAEYGEFQGGLINAITRSGTNKFRGALRANYISPSLTISNIQANEEGAEQSMRREVSGELLGPIIRDRLFYFIGGARIDRDVNVPNLSTAILDDFRSVRQNYQDTRGIAKLTLLPGLHDRIEALISHTDNRGEHADLNGLDDPAGTVKVRSPTTFYEAGWTRTGISSLFKARIAGYNSRESRLGYAGDIVPGIQLFTRGRQPIFQNAPFNQRTEPRSLGGNLTYSKLHSLARGENRLTLGAEYTRGSWTNMRTRNGGLTWLPYVNGATAPVDPADPRTWPDVASEWGGEMHLDSDVENAAVFIQDYLTLLPNLTITPGIRFGRWTGWLTPVDPSKTRFMAARDQGFDPRIGVVWDVSGRNDMVLKAHWGIYHQGMNSVFFDRAEGADVYSNERFYFQGPAFTDPRQVYTPAQRDAMLDTFTGFSPTYVESVLNEAGRVENYKQPYIQQAILSAEKRFGPRWKLEAVYTNRINKNIVGLVDRNLATNYSVLTNVAVKDRVTSETVTDQYGDPLILPVVWIANRDLKADLHRRSLRPPSLRKPTPGYSFADEATLTFNPDIVLTTVDGAKRSLHQASLSVRTEQERWNGFGSITYTRLRGNISGLTGFGTTGTEFSAGSAVRPNEAINNDGYLPNFPSLEGKVWLSGELLYGLRGGVFTSFTLGNYFTPMFQISPRFKFQAADKTILDDSLFSLVEGQSILLEERGSRKYQGRVNADLRLERRFISRPGSWIVSADLFNATASDAIVERNLTINDQISNDPTSIFAAPRRRVNPLSLQLGVRVEF